MYVTTVCKLGSIEIFIGNLQQLVSPNEPCHEKTSFMPYANNKHADQPAHPPSLISIFVVHCLDSIIPIVVIAKISSL